MHYRDLSVHPSPFIAGICVEFKFYNFWLWRVSSEMARFVRDLSETNENHQARQVGQARVLLLPSPDSPSLKG